MDDLEIARFGGVRILAIEKLEHLSVGDLARGPGHDPHDLHVAERHHHLKRARVERVSDQHRRLVAEQGVCGAAPAPELRVVNHVVVEQGRGVDELDDHRELDVPVPVVTQRTGGEQRQQWPHPLAAADDDVLGDPVHEDDVGREACSNGAIDGREIVADEGLNRGEVGKHWRRRGGSLGRRHG